MTTDDAAHEPSVGTSRRDVLLKVAADLFLRNSYDGVTVDMICTAAGISGPGLYNHFENKLALLVAVVESPWQPCTNSPEKPPRRSPIHGPRWRFSSTSTSEASSAQLRRR